VPAGGSLAAAEMTQMHRMARLMPPLCHLGLPLLYLLQFSGRLIADDDMRHSPKLILGRTTLIGGMVYFHAHPTPNPSLILRGGEKMQYLDQKNDCFQ